MLPRAAPCGSTIPTGPMGVWAPMSGDEALGYVYLPFSTPANDYYGGHRPGDNLDPRRGSNIPAELIALSLP